MRGRPSPPAVSRMCRPNTRRSPTRPPSSRALPAQIPGTRSPASPGCAWPMRNFPPATKTAAADYQKAAGSLKNEALLGRAKLGAAVSQLNGGDVAGGSAALKAVSTGTTLGKRARAEATYQLVSLAAEAGKTDEGKEVAAGGSKLDF